MVECWWPACACWPYNMGYLSCRVRSGGAHAGRGAAASRARRGTYVHVHVGTRQLNTMVPGALLLSLSLAVQGFEPVYGSRCFLTQMIRLVRRQRVRLRKSTLESGSKRLTHIVRTCTSKGLKQTRCNAVVVHFIFRWYRSVLGSYVNLLKCRWVEISKPYDDD
eukprot:COSAG02_NODE_2769_length_8063_cov_2.501130_1_plen_164_part_00